MLDHRNRFESLAVKREKAILRRLLLGVLVLLLSMSSRIVADEVIDGEIGPGALYRLVRPTNWNGSLLVYAHGFVDSDAPIALPMEGELLTSLFVPQGFALAYSSFSENGLAIKDGAQQTHQLIGIFTSQFEKLARIYISGTSLGGLITIKLVEAYPGVFAGALPVCAVAGGSQQQIDYAGHTRVLFDYFYPGILPGNVIDIPAGLDVQMEIIDPAISAMQSDPTGAFAMASMDQTPLPFEGPEELIASIATALALHAKVFPNIFSRTHGNPYFDNQDTQYSGQLDSVFLEAINTGVERFSASPAGFNYLKHYYEPSGNLRMPMLMLSTSRDPNAPGFNQLSYLDAVTAFNRDDWLVQREIERYGHCIFTPEELVRAFTDLVLWVEFGIKPAP